MTINHYTTATAFDVAADHADWLETIRQAVAPDDLDLFELCAARGFHLHPPTVLVHMGEVLDYTPEELHDEARWMRAMTLVHARGNHPFTKAFAKFARAVDGHMAAMAPPHEHGPYVEVVERDNGVTWPCSSFTFLDVLYWAESTDQVTAINFEHEHSSPVAHVTLTGRDLRDVGELHVAADEIRDALARHHYEHVDQGPDGVLQSLNAFTDAHCRDLLAGTRTYPHHDIWDLEKALADNRVCGLQPFSPRAERRERSGTSASRTAETR